jgi:ABC-2 type transport system permease protein
MAALFRTEMVKQWRRRRTYLVLATTIVVPVVIAIALRANPPTLTLGQGPEQRFSAFVNRTGLFLPVVSLEFMSQFLLVLIVALFAGDIVASEANWGTLRAMLTRPVSRDRLLAAKAGAATLMALVATALILVTGLVVGVIVFGWHPLDLPLLGAAGHQAPLHVVANLALAGLYVLWSVAGVAALAFLASTMTDSPSGALFAGFGLYVVSQILNNIASLDPVSFVLPTHDQNSWTALFTGHGPTRTMLHGVLLQIPYVVVFGGIAWWHFRRKDVLS